MRTNIVIDDELMQATLKATGLKTKREAVEQGLRTLLRLKRQRGYHLKDRPRATGYPLSNRS